MIDLHGASIRRKAVAVAGRGRRPPPGRRIPRTRGYLRVQPWLRGWRTGMQRLVRVARHVEPTAAQRAPPPAAAATSGTHSRQPIFKPEVLAAFDSEAYYRDGVWVFPSVMMDAARVSWLTALRESDEINNRITEQIDWAEDIDWASIGREPPTADEMQGHRTRGGFNTKWQIPDAWWFKREMYASGDRRIPFREGRRPASMPSPYVPATSPMEYHPFLLNALTHPQMLELHQRILRSSSIRFDHCSLVARKPGFAGQAAHSHPYSIPALEQPDAMGMQMCRTLAYPEGFGDDPENPQGGLTVVAGSHLFKNGHLSLGWGDFRCVASRVQSLLLLVQ